VSDTLIALDTSALVAALLPWHAHHEEASAALAEILASPAGAVLPLPSLIEAYAVMTRLPAPHRIRPAVAAELLRSSLHKRTRLVGLQDEQGWAFLESLVIANVAGGRSYDALIGSCAKLGGAGRILTLNARDFAVVAPGLELIVP